jgi:excisionase family DNA binding protein
MRSSEIALAEPLWTVREAAAFLRLGRNTVYEWAASGKLPSLRLGSRIRFQPAALRRWVAVQVDMTPRP